MKYFLIKNCKIIERQEQLLDILIANNKIIAIGRLIARPSVDTPIFDAKGKLAVPGFVNICSPFLSLNNTEDIRRLIHEDVAGGFTTWVGFESASQMNTTLQRLNKQELRTLNYSLHFDADQFKHGDINKMKTLSSLQGLPSMRYTLSSLTAAHNDRLDIYLTIAAQNNMLIMFALTDFDVAAEKIEAIETICNKINKIKCRTLFTNVKYNEEIDIISKLRCDNDTYAQICYTIPTDTQNNNGLTPIAETQLITLLRKNEWICADIIMPNTPTNERIIHSYEICSRNNINEDELIQFMTTRKCKIIGLTPEKGQIKVGSDADICIISKGQIAAVVQNGRITYDNGIQHENISGRQVFRRLIN